MKLRRWHSPVPKGSRLPHSQQGVPRLAWRTFAATSLILLLSACAEKPLVISADTSCERFRHISANDEQIKVFADNWAVMESYADQILAHNTEYDAKCLKEPK